ncbi:MAG: ClbS/DfsB family four-helix bundle protein [Streptococcaceae bacterium]|nr:ClbS/DfsB family four-helix bundle protein [Streptococcaceae bacterium]
MARPTTKTDLTKSANENFEKIWQLFDAMSDDEQRADFAFGAEMGKEAHWGRDKNLRDVFIHLYEWHQLLLNWINSNQQGEAQPFIPLPYNWKTYGQMNIEFVAKHQGTSLNDAVKMLRESHAEVMAAIESFSNDELFAKGLFPWTGASSLGSYCVSATASHYLWAVKKLKAQDKAYSKALIA